MGISTQSLGLNSLKLATLLFGFFMAISLLFSGSVFAADPPENAGLKKNLCAGASLSLSGSGNCDKGKINSNGNCVGPDGNLTDEDNCADANKLDDLIKTVVNILSVIIGVVAVIMIIIGGFKYITSGGDTGNVASAKNTIIYALVGLIVVALAQVIVRFVITKTTS